MQAESHSCSLDGRKVVFIIVYGDAVSGRGLKLCLSVSEEVDKVVEVPIWQCLG